MGLDFQNTGVGRPAVDLNQFKKLISILKIDIHFYIEKQINSWLVEPQTIDVWYGMGAFFSSQLDVYLLFAS